MIVKNAIFFDENNIKYYKALVFIKKTRIFKTIL